MIDRNQLLSKISPKDNFIIAVAILLIGLGAGCASYILHISVSEITKLVGSHAPFTWQTILATSALLLTSYCLTRYLFRDTQGSGIPQVKLALVALKGRMPKRMPFGKFLTTLSTLSSGLSFGVEGPLVSISSSWAHLVSHLLKINRQAMKVLVTAGASAGLSAAFNTPMAAVVFTVEEVLGQLNTKYLAPIIMASVIASVTSYKLFANTSTFLPIHYHLSNEWHLLLYMMLGLFMSVVGHFWCHSVILCKNINRRFFGPLPWIFMVLTLVALASHGNVELLGSGTQTINRLLQGNGPFTLKLMLGLFVFKFILAATSYSTGLSGGLFMPILFLGASGGGLFALSLQAIGINGIEFGPFALMGMTSLLVATIRIPFTAFVMMFEMTRDYELILPLMVSSIASFIISSLFCQESIYEMVAEYEGVHLPGPKDNETLSEMTIEECMVFPVKTFSPHDIIKDHVEDIQTENFGGYPVVHGNRLMGMVNTDEIIAAFQQDENLTMGDIMKRSLIKIYPDQSLIIAFDKMKRYEIGRLPVVSRFNDKALVGLITPEDIVRYLSISKVIEKS